MRQNEKYEIGQQQNLMLLTALQNHSSGRMKNYA
jgi:hypothetical protein